MSSLADELAADLDFSDDEIEQENDEHDVSNSFAEDAQPEESENDREESPNQVAQKPTDSIYKIAKFLHSKTTQQVFERIDHFTALEKEGPREIFGPIEEDEEYKLIVRANVMTAEIDGEIQTVHKYIRDHYAPRFPELESLVLNPLDYARTVKAIGNQVDLTKTDLRPILPSATIMVVTVTASTTSGRPLTDEEWKLTEEACDMALELDAARKKIINYVESKMSVIAPNLSNVVGSATAAKLITVAGGLSAFCKIPACNVEVLGNSKKANTGFSKVNMEHHAGFIYYSDLVRSVPADLRRKVTRIVAAKCSMAARIDASHSSADGSLGKRLREEIDQKIEKFQEAPPSKVIKALPVPDDGPKKRRGGRRARRMKEAYAMTELRAARNRMAFGEQEEEVAYGDETEGLGMATRQVGKIRASVADPRNKVKTPKHKAFNHTSGTATSGLASSLAFTPVQGIELIDPTAAAEKAKKANEKYFGDGQFSIIRK